MQYLHDAWFIDDRTSKHVKDDFEHQYLFKICFEKTHQFYDHTVIT